MKHILKKLNKSTYRLEHFYGFILYFYIQMEMKPTNSFIKTFN